MEVDSPSTSDLAQTRHMTADVPFVEEARKLLAHRLRVSIKFGYLLTKM